MWTHAQSLMAQTQPRFAELVSCGFDRGFHSPDNQLKLAQNLDAAGAALARKGAQETCSPAALENHGLLPLLPITFSNFGLN